MRQADPAERKRIDSSLSFAERSYLEFGGYFSATFVNLNDSDNNSRRYFSPEVGIYGRAVLDSAHTFFGRARFQYNEFSPGDSFDGRGDRWTDPFIDRYWYEFDYRSMMAAQHGQSTDWNVNVRVGRQFVDWGAGLVLSENLYAARPVFEFGRVTIEGLAGVTPGDKSVTDFDSSRADYNEETWRGYFGGRVAYRTRSSEEFYGYYLAQVDYNDDDNPQDFGVDHTYNSHYLGVGTTGSFAARWLYLAEFVYEFGDSRSDPLRGLNQTKEDISAWAARGQLTHLFADQNNSRAEFEALFASGDADRNDPSNTVGGNLSGTDDLGFNSLGFVNTGLAFAPSLSNLMSYRLGASTFPLVNTEILEQFQIGVDMLAFFKMNQNAPIDEATTDDTYLGFETDVYANYRITSDLAFSVRYGAFFPGTAIAGQKDTRHFIYLGMTLSF